MSLAELFEDFALVIGHPDHASSKVLGQTLCFSCVYDIYLRHSMTM
jgi:hypothetical protein